MAVHDHGDHVHPDHEGHAVHDAHAPVDDLDHYQPESLLMEQALRELLIEQGVFSAEDIQRQIDLTESRTPALGARIIARAWVDPEFRQTLLKDGKAAAASLGIPVTEASLTVVEDTPAVRNVIVCTLCSCYPRSLLGQPPSWYRNKAYRSRVVREPRKVLAEFGSAVPDDVEVHVHDSNADLRLDRKSVV